MQKSTMENTRVEQKGSWPVVGSAMSLLKCHVVPCHKKHRVLWQPPRSAGWRFLESNIAIHTKDVAISLQWWLHVILTKHHLSKICCFRLKFNTKIRESELTKCQDCCWDPPPPQQCASGFAQLVWPEPFQGLMKDRPVGLDKFKFHRNVVVEVVVVV